MRRGLVTAVFSSCLATRVPIVILTVAAGIAGPTIVDAAPTNGPVAPSTPVAPGAPPTPVAATKFSIAMTLVERSGATLAERNVDAALGMLETTKVQLKERTVTIDATVTAGRKPGCYKIDLVVSDRNIDGTGRFNKAVWQSATEPCDAQPITLGPKGEVRIRVAIKPAG